MNKAATTLWFLLYAARQEVIWFDERECVGCLWLSPHEVLAHPLAHP